VDEQVPPQEEELNPIAGKTRSETSVWHSDMALPCNLKEHWHIFSIETWNHCSMQWVWRLITAPSSTQQLILKEIRYVVGSVATAATLLTSFCEIGTGIVLYYIEDVTEFSYCIPCSQNKTIYLLAVSIA
jgi:hypothetical protein